VGSWAAEALARSGVAELVLIDLDHVAESNINRQVQALGSTLGQAKVQALRERIADIHPGCRVHAVEDFVARQLAGAAAAPVDAADRRLRPGARQGALAPGPAAGARRWSAWARRRQAPAQRVEVADLADVTHDPLLASLRQRLRKAGAAPRRGRIGLRCVFSREPCSARRRLRRRASCTRRQPGLRRLRLERDRHRHLRPGGRRRGASSALVPLGGRGQAEPQAAGKSTL
jgi:tRNA A37 threonylcarbamoyladenosine dehydratase